MIMLMQTLELKPISVSILLSIGASAPQTPYRRIFIFGLLRGFATVFLSIMKYKHVQSSPSLSCITVTEKFAVYSWHRRGGISGQSISMYHPSWLDMFASCVPVDHFLDRVLIAQTLTSNILISLRRGPSPTSHRGLCLARFLVDKVDVFSDWDQMGMLHKEPHYAIKNRVSGNLEGSSR